MKWSKIFGKKRQSFPFADAPDTAVIICCHSISGEQPILYVSHDAEDGMWQFLCGRSHETADARLVSLKEVFELDHSIGVLADMPCGYCVARKTTEDDWVTAKQRNS